MFFDGEDIHDVPLDVLRGGVGYVPQDNFLFSASVRENIRFYAPNATDEDVYAAIALTNCVTGRTSLGGTCVASVEAQTASVRDFLAGQTEAAKQEKNG